MQQDLVKIKDLMDEPQSGNKLFVKSPDKRKYASINRMGGPVINDIHLVSERSSMFGR